MTSNSTLQCETVPINDARSPETSVGGLEKVYAEAGQWVRLCNTIVWQMAAVFIPATSVAIGGAFAYETYRVPLAVASCAFFAVWVGISALYRKSAIDARRSLMSIERFWKIPAESALYSMHGQIGKSRFSLFRVQLGALVSLAVFWVIVLRFIR